MNLRSLQDVGFFHAQICRSCASEARDVAAEARDVAAEARDVAAEARDEDISGVRPGRPASSGVRG